MQLLIHLWHTNALLGDEREKMYKKRMFYTYARPYKNSPIRFHKSDDSNFIKEIVNFYGDMNFLQYQGILE